MYYIQITCIYFKIYIFKQEIHRKKYTFVFKTCITLALLGRVLANRQIINHGPNLPLTL